MRHVPGAAFLVVVALLSHGCRSASPSRTVSTSSTESVEATAAPAPEESAQATPAETSGDAVPPGSSAPPAKVHKNTIKWTTASEVDNFGFDVYRSLANEGPFERVNLDVIEGAGTTDEPSRYQFVDDTIDPHKAYFYYVESISMSGDREQFTPIGRIKAKIRTSEEADSGDETGGDSGEVR